MKKNVNNVVLSIFPRPEWKEATTCQGSRIFPSSIIWSMLDPDAPLPPSLPPSPPPPLSLSLFRSLIRSIMAYDLSVFVKIEEKKETSVWRGEGY